jgi:DNA-binding response OmpR family regulator
MIKRPTILLIDDNAIDLKISSLMLEKNGYEVITLNSAINCLDYILNQNIDLVILDIVMPNVDGKEALKSIRTTYNLNDLPIIMMTSKSDASDIIEALKLGANDYVTKPVNFEVAFRRIETLLQVKEQAKIVADTKEIRAIHSAIATYNHEINNPLTICIANLALLKKKYEHDSEFINMEKSLWRISDMLKNMEQLLANEPLKFNNYGKTSQMIAIENKNKI